MDGKSIEYRRKGKKATRRCVDKENRTKVLHCFKHMASGALTLTMTNERERRTGFRLYLCLCQYATAWKFHTRSFDYISSAMLL